MLRRFSALFCKAALLALAAVGGAAQSPVAALDYSKHAKDSDTETAIHAKGAIITDDAFRFQAYLSKLPRKQITSLYLESSGGSVQAAIALGRVVHKLGVRTYVIDGRGCQSACTMVFVAGRDGPDGKPFRVKGSNTNLGFHNFKPVLTDQPYKKADMERIEVRAQKTMFELAQYFEEIGADLEFLGLGLQQAAIRNARNDELLPLGVNILDVTTNELVRSDNLRR